MAVMLSTCFPPKPIQIPVDIHGDIHVDIHVDINVVIYILKIPVKYSAC